MVWSVSSFLSRSCSDAASFLVKKSKKKSSTSLHCFFRLTDLKIKENRHRPTYFRTSNCYNMFTDKRKQFKRLNDKNLLGDYCLAFIDYVADGTIPTFTDELQEMTWEFQKSQAVHIYYITNY